MQSKTPILVTMGTAQPLLSHGSLGWQWDRDAQSADIPQKGCGWDFQRGKGLKNYGEPTNLTFSLLGNGAEGARKAQCNCTGQQERLYFISLAVQRHSKPSCSCGLASEGKAKIPSRATSPTNKPKPGSPPAGPERGQHCVLMQKGAKIQSYFFQ